MVGFWEKQYDVLVATTIVESGLDIPNANTLIVDRADMFGLSQLHQLRGRVGRGRERGYAYFTYPPERPLTETAYDRLATIAQHTEMGAGMAVAHEGPGDPRIRATCSAASSPATSPASGSTCTCGWSARRSPTSAARRARERERPRSRSTCRSTPTCRSSTCPASGCGWRPIASLASATTDEAVDAVRAELLDRYGPIPDRGREPARGGAVQGGVPPLRRHRGLAAGQHRPVHPGRAARVGAAAAAPAVRQGRTTSRPVSMISVPRPKGVTKPDGSFAEVPVRRRAAARRGAAGLVRSGARTGHRALSSA